LIEHSTREHEDELEIAASGPSKAIKLHSKTEMTMGSKDVLFDLSGAALSGKSLARVVSFKLKRQLALADDSNSESERTVLK
jgi:hypothetical protein